MVAVLKSGHRSRKGGEVIGVEIKK
jgi:hypothetical protein